MQHYRHYYRSVDGSQYFDFYFYNIGLLRGWRIYIIGHIDYGNRNASFHSTHRLHDHSGTYDYICWNRRIASLKDAKRIAALWADTTALYIKNGGNFDTIANQLMRNR